MSYRHPDAGCTTCLLCALCPAQQHAHSTLQALLLQPRWQAAARAQARRCFFKAPFLLARDPDTSAAAHLDYLASLGVSQDDFAHMLAKCAPASSVHRACNSSLDACDLFRSVLASLG